MNYLALACRMLLAGIFLISLTSKLHNRRAYNGFVSATGSLLAVAVQRARRLALLTTVAECATVVLLALPGFAPVGFILSLGLLCSFAAAMISALCRGDTASCHCFGASNAPVSAHHVGRNAALVAVALVGLVADRLLTGQTYDIAGITITAVAVSALVLVIARLDDLVALLRSPVR